MAAGIHSDTRTSSARSETIRENESDPATPALDGHETVFTKYINKSILKQIGSTPAILKHSDMAKCGVPALIYRRSQKYRRLKYEIMRIETCMYYHGAVWLAKSGTRMNGKRFRQIKEEMYGSRWQKIRHSFSGLITGKRKVKKAGDRKAKRYEFETWDNLPEVWTLTPEYFLEIAEFERREYRRLYGSSDYYTPHTPPQRVLPLGAIYDTVIAQFLAEGLGIIPDHFSALNYLFCAPDREAFISRLKDWRLIAKMPAGIEIKPQYITRDAHGRIYLHPYIQGISRGMRAQAFMPAEHLSGFCELFEVDFHACSTQIMLALTGSSTLRNAWRYIANELHRHGFNVSPAAAKELWNPILCNQSRHQFAWYWSAEKALGKYATMSEVYDILTLQILPEVKQTNWQEIRKTEAIIMDLTLKELANNETAVCGIPLFDGLITPEPEAAEKALGKASEKILGKPLKTRTQKIRG